MKSIVDPNALFVEVADRLTFPGVVVAADEDRYAHFPFQCADFVNLLFFNFQKYFPLFRGRRRMHAGSANTMQD